jgi:hypothetical protein
MFTKQTFGLAIGSSLFATLAVVGCGPLDSTGGDPSGGSGKGPPINVAGGVEVTRSALNTNSDRDNMRAIATADHLFVTWIDNKNGVDQVWGMPVDDHTGAGWNGATPQVLVGASPIEWNDLAYDSVHDQIILGVDYTYSSVDHDEYVITLDHSGVPVTSLLVVDNTTNDDYGSSVAYDPTTQTSVIAFLRANPGTNHSIMASYMPPFSTPQPPISYNPLGVSSSLSFGGITYAKSSTQSRFVTTSDDVNTAYVSTAPANQGFATSRSFGRFSRLYTPFMASSFTVGMTGYDSTNGLSIIPFNTNACFGNFLCSLTAHHIVDAVPGKNTIYSAGAVDGNFIVVADPNRDANLKVLAVNPSGSVVKSRTYTTSTGVHATGAIVRGPTFNWIFWIDNQFRTVGQKIDDLGNGGGETVIAP